MPSEKLPFHDILVATDFSEHAGAALGRAIDIAEATGAAVSAVHVVSDVTSTVPGTSFAGHWRIPPGDIKKAEKELCRQAEKRLAAWITPFRKQAPKLRTEVLVGVPFVEIIRVVRKQKYDLVLAGTRGLSTVGRMLVGSTAERLVRNCPCPVWIVKPQHEWPVHSILVPLNCTRASSKILEIACAMAQYARSKLTVLHVLNVPTAEVAPLPKAVAAMDVRSQRKFLRQAAATELNELVTRYASPLTGIVQQLGIGNPWQVIVRTANRLDAGLIVMGTVGRTGIPGFIIGNTAEKVLRHCDRSILAVKPDGFVSPVR
jgi:nucleotide-binding universal stress UspA family protein